MLGLDGSPQACNFIRVDFNLFNQACSHRFNKYRDILPQFAQSLAEDVVLSRCLKLGPLDIQSETSRAWRARRSMTSTPRR